MKILAQGVPGNTYSGFQRAAEAAGHTWHWWEEQHTATFDVFDEVKPDLVFHMKPTRSLVKCLHLTDVPTVQGTEVKQFNFRINDCIVKKFERLVDKHIFNPGNPHPAYTCDIGIVTPPTPLGLQLCENIGEFNVKIMHEQPWNITTQYLGVGSLQDKRDLYRSSKLVLVDSVLEAMRVASCCSYPINFYEFYDDIKIALACDLVTCKRDVEAIIQFHCTASYQFQKREELDECLKGNSYDDALNQIMEKL